MPTIFLTVEDLLYQFEYLTRLLNTGFHRSLSMRQTALNAQKTW